MMRRDEVLFHEKVIGHVIIGEATLNLALGDGDISVQALIAELGRMAETEENDERLAQIADARSWLKNFVQPERLHTTHTQWQLQAKRHEQTTLPAKPTPFTTGDDDDN